MLPGGELPSLCVLQVLAEAVADVLQAGDLAELQRSTLCGDLTVGSSALTASCSGLLENQVSFVGGICSLGTRRSPSLCVPQWSVPLSEGAAVRRIGRHQNLSMAAALAGRCAGSDAAVADSALELACLCPEGRPSLTLALHQVQRRAMLSCQLQAMLGP